jgi:hypothetical protein
MHHDHYPYVIDESPSHAPRPYWYARPDWEREKPVPLNKYRPLKRDRSGGVVVWVVGGIIAAVLIGCFLGA